MQETQDHPRAYAVSPTKGGKWQGYLTTAGAITRLKLHALTFAHDKAIEVVARVGADNPDYEAKVARVFEVTK